MKEFGSDWELYNMSEDRTELHNLAATESVRVRSMSASYEEWAARCNVADWPFSVGDWSFPGMADDGTFDMRGHGHVIPW